MCAIDVFMKQVKNHKSGSVLTFSPCITKICHFLENNGISAFRHKHHLNVTYSIKPITNIFLLLLKYTFRCFTLSHDHLNFTYSFKPITNILKYIVRCLLCLFYPLILILNVTYSFKHIRTN